jgi:acyl-coenzyme A synthetase/AMP-(fatty) acid ligase
VRGQVSLLPPSMHGAIVRQLVARFPDVYCLAEAVQASIDLPQTLNLADGTLALRIDVPEIADDQTIAHVFTSGSTGAPTLHRKRWGALVVNVRSEAERLGCAAGSTPAAIVATVPPQHMYGFESSLLMAWQSGNALVAERPFYPADIAAALARLPAPRMLVTTPFHLRAWLDDDGVDDGIDDDGDDEVDDDGERRQVETIVCATAPLPPSLAQRAEQQTGAPVLEIYGCTETGQLASRRPTVDPLWRPLGDIALRIVDGRAIASGGHIEEPTALADLIEPAQDFPTTRRFALAGRSADLVNIAGKRTSLGHLNLQLTAIAGVVDGVFMMPGDDADNDANNVTGTDEAARGGITRLAAVVVAPSLDATRLLAELRLRIDPVFLPRPLYFVDRLPRNTTGKLTHAVLADLVASLQGRRPDGPRAIASGPNPS